MRKTLIIISILLAKILSLSAQKKISGNYYNYFGSRMEIHADSTFKYRFHLDTESSWTTGTWKLKKDTIYFTMIPVYDTIIYKDSLQKFRIDSLILSVDEVSERLTSLESISGYLLSYGQNRHGYPDKLFYLKNKLFQVRNGQLYRDRVKGFWTHKKFVPWYIRELKKRH